VWSPNWASGSIPFRVPGKGNNLALIARLREQIRSEVSAVTWSGFQTRSWQVSDPEYASEWIFSGWSVRCNDRTVSYSCPGACLWHTPVRLHFPQPHNPAAVHAFDVFIAATRDCWTKANRTRAVVKFVPLGLAVYIFVHVNRNSSTLRTRLSRQRSRVRVPCTRRVPRFGVSLSFLSVRRMNNLLPSNSPDGSSPTAPAIRLIALNDASPWIVPAPLCRRYCGVSLM